MLLFIIYIHIHPGAHYIHLLIHPITVITGIKDERPQKEIFTPGGGGYSLIYAIYVRAAGQGMVLSILVWNRVNQKAFLGLEQGISFPEVGTKIGN